MTVGATVSASALIVLLCAPSTAQEAANRNPETAARVGAAESRGWLLLTRIQTVSLDPPSVVFWLTNYGKTPLRVSAEAIATGPSIPEDCGLSLKPLNIIPPDPIIPGGAHRTAPPVSALPLDPATTGSLPAVRYVFGYVKYTDSNDLTNVRITRLCIQRAALSNRAPTDVPFNPCDRCTDTD